MRTVFAVCDTEQTYAFNLMEYLNSRLRVPFEIQMFTAPEALVSFASVRHVDLLLVSERAATEEVRNLPVGKLMILSEGSVPESLAAYPAVSKYQSADQVVREVMDFYSAQQSAAEPARILRPDCRKIGVISTWEPGLRTAFAIALGEILAERRNVLYVSLDPWDGTASLFDDHPDRTISDLLYYYRQGKNGLIYCAESMIRTVRGMHYIPPAAHPGDLLLMNAEQWSGLFNELTETGACDTLILDMGSRMTDPEGILSFCSEIYLPVSADLLAERSVDTWLLWAEDNHAEWSGRVETVPLDRNTVEEIRAVFDTGDAGNTSDVKMRLEALNRGLLGRKIREAEDKRQQEKRRQEKRRQAERPECDPEGLLKKGAI